MQVKFILYIIVGVIVIWSLDSVNINGIFKQNKVYQARCLYFMLALSLTYLVTNFIYDFYISFV